MNTMHTSTSASARNTSANLAIALKISMPIWQAWTSSLHLGKVQDMSSAEALYLSVALGY